MIAPIKRDSLENFISDNELSIPRPNYKSLHISISQNLDSLTGLDKKVKTKSIELSKCDLDPMKVRI